MSMVGPIEIFGKCTAHPVLPHISRSFSSEQAVVLGLPFGPRFALADRDFLPRLRPLAHPHLKQDYT